MNACFDGWRAEDGNSKGRCCCNCEYQYPLSKHPGNKGIFQGRVTEVFGYACMPLDLYPYATFFDFKHGMCECWGERKFERTKDAN